MVGRILVSFCSIKFWRFFGITGTNHKATNRNGKVSHHVLLLSKLVNHPSGLFWLSTVSLFPFRYSTNSVPSVIKLHGIQKMHLTVLIDFPTMGFNRYVSLPTTITSKTLFEVIPRHRLSLLPEGLRRPASCESFPG